MRAVDGIWALLRRMSGGTALTSWWMVAWRLLACAVLGGTPSLSAEPVFVFAGVEEGRSILTNRDDFIHALSAFDRAARVKRSQVVSEEAFLAHVGRCVRAWSAAETNKLGRVGEQVGRLLAGWKLPLPPRIPLIKSSGDEEGQAAYTRQTAIILPEHLLQDPEPTLSSLIVHELFHVMSRHEPELRRRLYHWIGFSPIGPIVYPVELRDRRITNPDGYETGWSITVTHRNRAVPVVPILHAKQDRYDPQRGGEFFNDLVFKLLVVTNSNGAWQPLFESGQLQLLEPAETAGLYDQIGRNTDYIIHPDEILADNFVYLVTGRTRLATPRIVDGMALILHDYPSQGHGANDPKK